jgi:heme A synthase
MPPALRTLLRLSLAIAIVHIAFGALVRISGSGMGCGPYWPQCHGAWFPPLDRPALVIEWTHRLLALLLTASVGATAVVAWRARREAGVGGRGGVLAPALLALALVLAAAIFGAVTVWMGNAPAATVGHWTLAAALLATLAVALVRAGDFGGAQPAIAAPRLVRATAAAAILALLVLVFGGLTAKVPGANLACDHFPLCGPRGDVPMTAGLARLQMTHRILAFLLFFHLLGISIGARRYTEARAAVRAVRTAFALALLQVVIAAAMVGLGLPPALRSAHQITGVLLWVTVVVALTLARRADPAGAPAPPSIAVIIARGAGA